MAQLFIEESGQENTKSVVFLHASGSSSEMWRHHIAALKSDFHCILIDLPGHGNSRNIEWTDFDDVTEKIADIIKDKAHGKPHLVGLSLGGSLILKLLEKQADLVDKVIVDGAAHQPIKGSRKIIAIVYLMSLLKDTEFVARLMAKMMQENGVPEEECQLFVADLQRATKRSFRRAMSQANILKVKANFNNPAFFVSGEKESETIHQSHRMLTRQNAQSDCAYYPGGSHAWMLSDIASHIQLVKYFLQGGDFPEKLHRTQ
ncbi:alpha/beta hydrolase [Corynebacterium durum]|uniref:alpha/beta fold hydrolase n=1 Tax=Corynebacterium durum TaxID=61592 RepID=UPI0028E8D8A1|nr:alpha/beta hydrolase [Corynebacterium durum]